MGQRDCRRLAARASRCSRKGTSSMRLDGRGRKGFFFFFWSGDAQGQDVKGNGSS